MVAMGFGMDDESHGLWRKLLDDLKNSAGVSRCLAAVNQHDALLGPDDRHIRILVFARIDIDSVLNCFHVRPEILCPCGLAFAHQDGKENDCNIAFHDSHRSDFEKLIKTLPREWSKWLCT